MVVRKARLEVNAIEGTPASVVSVLTNHSLESELHKGSGWRPQSHDQNPIYLSSRITLYITEMAMTLRSILSASGYFEKSV